jgi:hypothetical protein
MISVIKKDTPANVGIELLCELRSSGWSCNSRFRITNLILGIIK